MPEKFVQGYHTFGRQAMILLTFIQTVLEGWYRETIIIRPKSY